MMRKLVLTATAAVLLAFAATALAAPITLEQATTRARESAKFDRAKWPVPSQTKLKGPKCGRRSPEEVRCSYILIGPMKKGSDRKRSCMRVLSVTFPDGAARPAAKRVEGACGGVAPRD